MAKTHDNNLTDGLSGKIGQVVYRQRLGETIACKKPRRRTSNISAAEQAVRSLFKEASVYAKNCIKDAEKFLFYKAFAKKGRSAYLAAMADFLRPPVIGEIKFASYNGSIGSSITASVTDDCKVASVKFRIEKSDGALVEEGNASPDSDGLHWIYQATVSNASVSGDRIIVTAIDKPGHDSVKTVNI
jgi:hypothetical protein